MAAACTAPIASPTHYDASFKVDVRLHESLLARGITPSAVRQEMMSLCSQLDTLCRKEQTEHMSGHTEHGRFSNSFTDRATVVYDRMTQVLSKGQPTQDCLSYIQAQRLDQLFPRAVMYLQNPQNLHVKTELVAQDNYLSNLAALNQLSVLARQMHSDLINLSDQKYVAHQLALLYQSVGSIKGNTFLQHKQSIEENFKAIKATLSGGDELHRPSLTPGQREWLTTLTSNIVNTVDAFPAELTQEMLLPGLVLQTKAGTS